MARFGWMGGCDQLTYRQCQVYSNGQVGSGRPAEDSNAITPTLTEFLCSSGGYAKSVSTKALLGETVLEIKYQNYRLDVSREDAHRASTLENSATKSPHPGPALTKCRSSQYQQS